MALRVEHDPHVVLWFTVGNRGTLSYRPADPGFEVREASCRGRCYSGC